MAANKRTQILIISVILILSTLAHVYENTQILKINNAIIDVGIASAIISLIISILIIITWKRAKATISIRDVIVSLIGGGMGFSGIISMIAFLIGVGWLTDDLREGRFWLALNSLGLIGSISGLYALSITLKKKPKYTIYPTKVLFSALSIPANLTEFNIEEIMPRIKTFFDEITCSPNKSPSIYISTSFSIPLGNIFFPILWRLKCLENKEIHVYLLISQKIRDKNMDNKFTEVLKAINLHLFNNKATINVFYSEPVDFNDYHAISQELECLLNKALRNHDEGDIAFNISPGTSAVTSAMILAALKEARQIEYITQFTDPVELKAFDITEEEILRFGILNK